MTQTATPTNDPTTEAPPVVASPMNGHVRSDAVAAEAPAGQEATEKDPASEPIIRLDSVSFYYGAFRAVKDVSIAFTPKQITALIGPSGCGKSTFIRCLNRLHEVIPEARA